MLIRYNFFLQPNYNVDVLEENCVPIPGDVFLGSFDVEPIDLEDFLDLLQETVEATIRYRLPLKTGIKELN